MTKPDGVREWEDNDERKLSWQKFMRERLGIEPGEIISAELRDLWRAHAFGFASAYSALTERCKAAESERDERNAELELFKRARDKRLKEMSDMAMREFEWLKERDALTERCLGLERERDGARAALEDRDKLYEQHLQEHRARMHRAEARVKELEAELKSARTIKRAVNDKARAHDDGALAYHVLRAELKRKTAALERAKKAIKKHHVDFPENILRSIEDIENGG